MKVGILSMQRVVNYGSFLQAYALKELVKEVVPCSEVKFIDIKPGVNLCKPSVLSKSKNIINAIGHGKLLSKVEDKLYSKKLGKQFRENFYQLLNLDDTFLDDELLDNVIIGSDEVFNCLQNTSWGFTKQLFGEIENTKNVFSYAASFGSTTLEQINKFGITEDIVNAISNLSSVSVRDKNSRFILETITTCKIEEHLDPVLIYDFSKRIAESDDYIISEKYMVVYSYTGRINNKAEIQNIKRFAKRHGLKIVPLFCQYAWASKPVFPKTPFQLLKIISNAEFVVSDTFHGTIFSIITHKKFATLMRNSATNKITSMLEKLDLKNHIVSEGNSLEDILSRDINYKQVEGILNTERERAYQYLKRNLE